MIKTSRRGLLGMLAAGVGATIVRTPGLLMSIKPYKFFTLDDYAARILNPMASMLIYGDESKASDAFHGIANLPREPASSIWLVNWSREPIFGVAQ